MLIPELAAKQQAKVKRKPSRKHEGVRNPTARNAIIKDRESGMYLSNADAALATEVKYLAQRLNAMELNLSKLLRDGAVSNGYAAPLPSNVVPMDVARKAKEQSKVVHVSQSGNEAEVHVLPAPEPVIRVEPALKIADVEPKFIGKGAVPVTSRVAANDNVQPDEVSPLVMEEDQQFIAGLASQYQFSLVEVNEILTREWLRRDKWCRKHHGKPREEVRLERAIRKRGVVEGAYFRSEDTKFSDWWNETESRMKHLRSLAEGRRVAEATSNRAPLVKGEAKYRKKAMIRRLASERRANPSGYAHVQKVSSQLYVPPPVTTASQWAAITTWAHQTKNKVRSLFGMQPVLRGKKLRDKFEVLDALSAAPTEPATTEGGDRWGRKPEPDLNTPTRELVRRYQRNGISH
jgi:hypothetical protein